MVPAACGRTSACPGAVCRAVTQHGVGRSEADGRSPGCSGMSLWCRPQTPVLTGHPGVAVGLRAAESETRMLR